MKELEEKIHKMIFSGVKDFSIVSHTPDILTENIIDISKEVKDIAIEFANYFDDYVVLAYNGKDIPVIDSSELFDQFIKERYSK